MQEQNNDQKSLSDNSQVTNGGVGNPTSDQADQVQSQQSQQSQTQQTTSTKLPTDAAEIVEDGDSRAIADKNEGSWPPPNIRDEIVEGAKQEEATHHPQQNQS